MTDPVSSHRDGTVLSVRVVPGASSSGLQGVQDGAVRVRVSSPPVDGRATAQLCEVVAAALGLRPREVEVLRGHTSRSKLLLVRRPEADVRARLLAAIGPFEGSSG